MSDAGKDGYNEDGDADKSHHLNSLRNQSTKGTGVAGLCETQGPGRVLPDW